MSHTAVPLYSAVNYKEASFGVYSVGLAFRIAADSNPELYIPKWLQPCFSSYSSKDSGILSKHEDKCPVLNGQWDGSSTLRNLWHVLAG